jgi:hypothetical protein
MTAETALTLARICLAASIILAAGGSFCLAVAGFDRHADRVIRGHIDQALAIAQPGGGEALPPPGHPDHPDQHSDPWARTRFEHLVIDMDARRAARRRHP